MKVSEAVAMYVALRDKKAALKAELDEQLKPINERMEKLEAKLLEVLDTLDGGSIKTDAGTAYISTLTSVSVADRSVFMDHVRSKDDWGLVEVRASKAGVTTYRDAHDGDLPPGVNLREERTVNIRRA